MGMSPKSFKRGMAKLMKNGASKQRAYQKMRQLSVQNNRQRKGQRDFNRMASPIRNSRQENF